MEVTEGGNHVYVQPFPPTGAKFQALGAAMRTPAWSADGTRLFFHDLLNTALL